MAGGEAADASEHLVLPNVYTRKLDAR
jgi:hypothetical protein